MARKRKNKSRNMPTGHKTEVRLANRPEDRASVAVTVAWMLTVLCAAGAEILAGIGYAVVIMGPTPGQVHPLAPFPGLMLLIAVITGIVSLVLTPIVYLVQRGAIPRAITTVAMIVGLLPLVTITLLLLF